jgi:hypothetical protein
MTYSSRISVASRVHGLHSGPSSVSSWGITGFRQRAHTSRFVVASCSSD